MSGGEGGGRGGDMECLSVVAGMSACCGREISGYEVRGTDLLIDWWTQVLSKS